MIYELKMFSNRVTRSFLKQRDPTYTLQNQNRTRILEDPISSALTQVVKWQCHLHPMPLSSIKVLRYDFSAKNRSLK